MPSHINESYILNQLKSSFTDFDISLFKFNFNLYTLKKDSNNKFIINLYDIYSYVGFTRKSDAKKLLVNKFTENKDYKITIKHSGTIPEQVLLTIDCFKIFCLTASTNITPTIYKYYIKIEESVINYLEELNKNQIKQLEDKDKIIELQSKQLDEKNKQLENIINQKYEEIHKSEFIYVFTTDKDNVYKCGKTKEPKKRKDQLQTGCVDDIEELFKYETSNNNILESIIHYILQHYRCNAKREHFRCNVDYIKLIISISGIFLDTLKSSYEYITTEELLDKLHTKLKYNITINKNIKIVIPKQITLLEEKLIDNNTILSNITHSNNEISNSSTSNLTLNKVKTNTTNISCYTENICNWMLEKYTKTNCPNDIIKLKKIYELFIRSKYYINLTEIQKQELKYEHFILELQSCIPLKKYIIKQYIHKTFILIKFKYTFNNK